MNDFAQTSVSRRSLVTTAGVLAAAGLAGGTRSAHAATSEHADADKPLQGQVALVTGAARGIGRAISEAYARAGADVVMLDIAQARPMPTLQGYELADAETFREAGQAVREAGQGREPLLITADVRDAEAMRNAVAQSTERFGRLDIAVANAGIAIWHSFMEGTPDTWGDVIDVNVHGVFNTFHAAARPMLEHDGGRLIAISSIGGRQGTPGNGAYCASKWAVIGLVKQAAIELGPRDIAVNAIAPGPVDTPLYRSEGQQTSMGVDTDEAQDQILNPLLPLGDRPALSPHDIADAALFLAGPGASTISGHVMDVALGYNANYTA